MLYRGLRSHISIAELMDKASNLNDEAGLKSLMNLVMQFRKVGSVLPPFLSCAANETIASYSRRSVIILSFLSAPMYKRLLLSSALRSLAL